jgi:hypothetical protein
LQIFHLIIHRGTFNRNRDTFNRNRDTFKQLTTMSTAAAEGYFKALLGLSGNPHFSDARKVRILAD